MNIPFDIVKGKGPVIFDPVHSASQVDEVREFIPEDSVPYVGEALTILRKEVRVSYKLPLHPCFIISIHTYFYC
jgi:uroporphyrinogen-III decarboxylase